MAPSHPHPGFEKRTRTDTVKKGEPLEWTSADLGPRTDTIRKENHWSGYPLVGGYVGVRIDQSRNNNADPVTYIRGAVFLRPTVFRKLLT